MPVPVRKARIVCLHGAGIALRIVPCRGGVEWSSARARRRTGGGGGAIAIARGIFRGSSNMTLYLFASLMGVVASGGALSIAAAAA
jgi:hypothetical protein